MILKEKDTMEPQVKRLEAALKGSLHDSRIAHWDPEPTGQAHSGTGFQPVQFDRQDACPTTRFMKSLTDGTRSRIEKDLAVMRSGIKGEAEAAYHIDFDLKDSANWVVIHDLRIEWKDRVAQIDHLLLNRFLGVHVLESKNYKTKLRQANGGWERLRNNHWEGIASPEGRGRRTTFRPAAKAIHTRTWASLS